MNPFNNLLCAVTSLLVLSVAPLASSAASDQPVPQKARLLTKLYPYGERARDVFGMSVRGSTGEDLGKLKDLVVDPRSGRIVYGIVSTGGVLGVGDTQRAVPFSAISYASDAHESLKIDLSLTDWQRAPLFNSDYLVSLADQDKADYIFQYYHQTWEPLADDPDHPAASPTVHRIERASSIIGREVRAGDQKIGEAEDLILNVGSRRAQVLLRPDPTFAGSTDHFVVPFTKLTTRTNDSDTLATSLTRDDFKSVETFDSSAWTNNPSRSLYRWKIAEPVSSHANSE